MGMEFSFRSHFVRVPSGLQTISPFRRHRESAHTGPQERGIAAKRTGHTPRQKSRVVLISCAIVSGSDGEAIECW